MARRAFRIYRRQLLDGASSSLFLFLGIATPMLCKVAEDYHDGERAAAWCTTTCSSDALTIWRPSLCLRATHHLHRLAEAGSSVIRGCR